jgi:hypothetical protein
MVKVIGACSPVFLAASMLVAVVDGQTSTANLQPQQQITAIGCITRNGVVDVDKGTRLLNMDPDGLALTTARVIRTGNSRSSAVPGSQPDGANSGTIPDQTIVGGARSGDPDTVTFALAGAQVKALGEHVGRRIEVVGRVTSTGQATAAQPRGTSGRDAAPVPGVGTREERPAEASAHPSTELPKLEVMSFRAATGPCQ